ncbi:hypothetical protein [Thermoflavifilum thermophilum]|uniref:Uncharacterized protein n=1 Tax=Thermoflavifilum thermophilum TaxID=1393122 RepID=A0A1I7NAU2_9BACT|nr:hypothetical protein [Thermoflavifilum thermophilum]SFV31703.1 hypothetical protein SAMN05660895_1153 [Thermoflavifilum thermophilum]
MPSKDAFEELKAEYRRLRKACAEQEEALARQWVYVYNHSGELIWNTVLDTSKGLGKSLLQVLFRKKGRSSGIYTFLFSIAQLWLLKKIADWREKQKSHQAKT